MLILGRYLTPETHLPCYQICQKTAMNAYKWNTSRVTVREGSKTVQAEELRTLCQLSHPQLLLMMGHTEDLRIVYEPVLIGSLYLCLHQHKIQVSVIDVCLQVTSKF